MVPVHCGATEITNIRPRERRSYERGAAFSGSIEGGMQKEPTYEDGGHTRPDESFGNPWIGGLESLQIRVRLALLEKKLHLPPQAVQCPDAQRHELLRGKRGKEEDVRLLLRDVDANESHSVGPSVTTDSFDQKIDIFPGQDDLLEPLADDSIDIRESPIAADDARIGGGSFRSANDVTASFSDTVEVLIADVAGVGEEQLVLEFFLLDEVSKTALYIRAVSAWHLARFCKASMGSTWPNPEAYALHYLANGFRVSRGIAGAR